VVGLGRLGYTHAVNLAHNVSRASLAAVCDMDEAQRTQVAQELRCEAYAEVEQMLAEARLDAVIVATPSAHHVGPVTQAANAGLPLFCEKPLASTLADNEKLAAVIRDAGILCQIGFNRRFDPEYAEARERIAAGEIGQPVYCYSVSRDPFPPPVWACDPAQGGGLFIDMQLHDYDMSRFLLADEPVRIHAEETALAVDGQGINRFADNVTSSLRFAGGKLALLHASMHAAYGYDVYTEVYGENGSIRIGGPEKGRLQVATAGRGVSWPQTFLGAEGVPHFIRRFERSFVRELDAFCGAVIDGKEAPVTPTDAVAAFRIAARAIESAGAGTSREI
jgi:predicted dehydrogenase